MDANRTFLIATAAVFAVFGLWGALDPDAMVQRFGIVLNTPEGRTLVRASYGGFLLGAASLFAYCALKSDRYRLGNVAVVLLTAPIFAVRAFGMLADGASLGMHAAYLGIEAVGVAIAFAFWLRGR